MQELCFQERPEVLLEHESVPPMVAVVGVQVDVAVLAAGAAVAAEMAGEASGAVLVHIEC